MKPRNVFLTALAFGLIVFLSTFAKRAGAQSEEYSGALPGEHVYGSGAVRCVIKSNGEVIGLGGQGSRLPIAWSKDCGDFPTGEVASKAVQMCQRHPNGAVLRVFFNDGDWTTIQMGTNIGSLCKEHWREGWQEMPSRTPNPREGCFAGRGGGPCDKPVDIDWINGPVIECVISGGDVLVTTQVADGTTRRWRYPWNNRAVKFCDKNGRAIAAPPTGRDPRSGSPPTPRTSSAPPSSSTPPSPQPSRRAVPPTFSIYQPGSAIFIRASNTGTVAYKCVIDFDWQHDDFGTPKGQHTNSEATVNAGASNATVLQITGAYVNLRVIGQPSYQCNPSN